MPFLWVSGAATVDAKALASRLCPYRGAIHFWSRGQTQLWHSSLAQWPGGPDVLELPARSHVSACSAHGRVEVRPDGAFHFSTDALGTLPLWRFSGDGFDAVSPEVKAFTAITGVAPRLKPHADLMAPGQRPIDWSPYENVTRLPPGSQWLVTGKTWAQRVPSPWPMLLSTSGDRTDTGELGDALEQSLCGLECQAAGAFISGGIDSSIAAALLQARDLRTFSLGTRLGNEFAQAAEAAQFLHGTHSEHLLIDDRVISLWNDVIRANEIFDGMTAEIVLQLAALVEAARATVNDVATGYGADLLFGGMLRHEGYLNAVGVRSTAALIARTVWTGEFSPFYAWQHGVAMHPVFWTQEVIRAGLRLDPAIHFDGTHEKVPLRRLALARGWLTEPLAFRPKVGMTVGTAAHQVVCEQLGLTQVMNYEARSRLAIDRLLFELEQHAPS